MGGAASGAAAQYPPGAVVQALSPDDGEELRGYLTTLANNPRSLDALIGAGRAALEMGDANAALTFFGRADELSSRDARVKAGIASALVRMGQAETALSLFAEAVALGAPVAEIAGDRGLAYDMIGDPRRAQHDYVAAIRHRDDPELRRRLALSLAISGHRDAAQRLIAGQLRQNDRAAWRTQAFVLALTGDAAGAGRIAQSQVGAGEARQMAPFLARLDGLSPAQKALAVHLGRFPSDGMRAQSAHLDVSPDPAALALAGVTAPQAAAPPGTRARSGNRERTTQRRRERSASRDSYPLRGPRGELGRTLAEPSRPASRETEIAQVETRWAGSPYPQPQSTPQQPQPQPSRPAVSAPPGAAPARPDPSPAADTPSIVPVAIPASAPARSAVAAVDGPPASPSSSRAEAAPQASDDAPSLADIAAVVNALPEDPRRRPAPEATGERLARSERSASTSAGTRAPAERRAQPANPRRHWVQIAGGIDRASMPREFARLRRLAPEQLRARTAFAAAEGSSRLLVGPFATAGEAQAFVNALAGEDVASFAWTSAAGQEIEPLPR